uniref:Golgi to ER traffic protein 4 homolog n=1 Tax=Syphacia muris TaxID=451379 RepID=A0A0N5ARC5_9BILA
MSKIEKLEKRISDCFENTNYYEAHQLYRTLYFRLSTHQEWDELQRILCDGILKLVEVNEHESAIDLGELYIEVMTKAETPVNSESLEKFEKLFTSLFPKKERNENQWKQGTDQKSRFLAQAVKWSMSVSEKKRYKQKGHADLHGCIAKVLWNNGDYGGARNHFMLSDEPEEFAKFLVDYQQKDGCGNEKDLFAVQAVLQLLCNRRPRTASLVLVNYCKDHPSISDKPPYNFPLLNFARYLILVIRAKKVEMFTRLIETYDFHRDPSFTRYLDKIGQVYLGVPAPQKQSDFLGNLLKGLVGSSQTAGNSSSEGTTEEISEDELFQDTEDEEKEELEQLLNTSAAAEGNYSSAGCPVPLQTTDDMELD